MKNFRFLVFEISSNSFDYSNYLELEQYIKKSRELVFRGNNYSLIRVSNKLYQGLGVVGLSSLEFCSEDSKFRDTTKVSTVELLDLKACSAPEMQDDLVLSFDKAGPSSILYQSKDDFILDFWIDRDRVDLQRNYYQFKYKLEFFKALDRV